MCSIGTNATASAHLEDLKSSGGDKLIENKLRDFAGNSSVEQSGILDLPKFHLHGMPDDLKEIRRIRIGRHRIFYTGYHTDCNYSVFYVKQFKRAGTEDESDPRFHRILKAALADRNTTRAIRQTDPPSEPK